MVKTKSRFGAKNDPLLRGFQNWWLCKMCHRWHLPAAQTVNLSSQKVKMWHKNLHPFDGIPELMAFQICASFWQLSAAGTANFLLTKSQELPQKLASHWADSQTKIESFWPSQSEAYIGSFQSWKGGGRPAGWFCFSSLELFEKNASRSMTTAQLCSKTKCF